VTARRLVGEWLLPPGTGKAIEVPARHVLRIEQVDGGQCVDFNAFNLHDYKEFMHCGRTRTVHGFNPGVGDFLWSAPPRERAMFYLLADSVGRNDVLFPRCSAYVYESTYGFRHHTNCHDIQAEAQREYGLTPDDVHDSFNLFMATEVLAGGQVVISRQDSQPGDHVELLALIDTLAVPNVCGADVMRTSNFFLKPVKVLLYTASDDDLGRVPATPVLASQRTPADFRNPVIKADRALRRDASYEPQFLGTPLTVEEVVVELSDEELAWLDGYEHAGLYRGDRGAVLRDIFFSWWETQYVTSPNGAPSVRRAASTSPSNP
jgi:uncharacterized protein YcgI (DUF1989 family)